MVKFDEYQICMLSAPRPWHDSRLEFGNPAPGEPVWGQQLQQRRVLLDKVTAEECNDCGGFWAQAGPV